MRQIALFCLALVSPAFTTGAVAEHFHHKHPHHRPLSAQYAVPAPVPAPESWTTVGTPDCHTQGRLFRVAHHCPPAAVAAAPVEPNYPPSEHRFSRW
jgi:hypothetical protein